MTDGERRNKIRREEPIPRQEFGLHWRVLFAELPGSELIQSHRRRPAGSELTFRKLASGAAELSSAEFPWASWLPAQGGRSRKNESIPPEPSSSRPLPYLYWEKDSRHANWQGRNVWVSQVSNEQETWTWEAINGYLAHSFFWLRAKSG